VIFPSTVVSIAVFGVNPLGDTLRDVVNPGLGGKRATGLPVCARAARTIWRLTGLDISAYLQQPVIAFASYPGLTITARYDALTPSAGENPSLL
jgi:hypothetical protein